MYKKGKSAHVLSRLQGMETSFRYGTVSFSFFSYAHVLSRLQGMETI